MRCLDSESRKRGSWIITLVNQQIWPEINIDTPSPEVYLGQSLRAICSWCYAKGAHEYPSGSAPVLEEGLIALNPLFILFQGRSSKGEGTGEGSQSSEGALLWGEPGSNITTSCDNISLGVGASAHIPLIKVLDRQFNPWLSTVAYQKNQ